MRDAGALADPSGADIAVVDVPTLLMVVFVAAAGEDGHTP
jgi:hypothetical protein